MTQTARHLREWLPAAVSIAAVLVAAGYAVTKTASAADEIREARELAWTLGSTADQVEKTAISPDQIEQLKARRKDLEHRMLEARKPGLIVPELTEAARTVGLDVREIQPARVTGPGAGGQNRPEYPRYRIMVHGSYRQIAEYMELCEQQRIPARVKEFRVARRTGGESAGSEAALTADIVVEAFQPADTMQQEDGAP